MAILTPSRPPKPSSARRKGRENTIADTEMREGIAKAATPAAAPTELSHGQQK